MRGWMKNAHVGLPPNIKPDQLVEVNLRNGGIQRGRADKFMDAWDTQPWEREVIQYRKLDSIDQTGFYEEYGDILGWCFTWTGRIILGGILIIILRACHGA